ncbi:MAG: hypothetical protein KJ072_10680 [Verrucomicrobia bacterium]|nr:hypothetical protein [Verrucomicrobiota bacterium]
METSVPQLATAPLTAQPWLEPGDRLSRVEFERRYERLARLGAQGARSDG